jgi:hypothetical protein
MQFYPLWKVNSLEITFFILLHQSMFDLNLMITFLTPF